MITVAVLGLGSMGLPMARHLARDFTVRAFDVNPDRRELAGEVGTVAASAREAVAGAAIVVVAVVNQEQFERGLHLLQLRQLACKVINHHSLQQAQMVLMLGRMPEGRAAGRHDVGGRVDPPPCPHRLT